MKEEWGLLFEDGCVAVLQVVLPEAIDGDEQERHLVLVVPVVAINHSSTTHQPLINHSSTTHQPLINHSSTTHQPLINHSSTTHQPFINHSSTTHQPLINHSSTTHQPLINHSSTTHQPLLNHSSTIHQPLTYHSQTLCSKVQPRPSIHTHPHEPHLFKIQPPSPSTLPHPPTIHHPPFTTSTHHSPHSPPCHHPPFTPHHSPPTIHHPPFTTHPAGHFNFFFFPSSGMSSCQSHPFHSCSLNRVTNLDLICRSVTPFKKVNPVKSSTSLSLATCSRA